LGEGPLGVGSECHPNLQRGNRCSDDGGSDSSISSVSVEQSIALILLVLVRLVLLVVRVLPILSVMLVNISSLLYGVTPVLTHRVLYKDTITRSKNKG
jgi:hypothetical protein